VNLKSSQNEAKRKRHCMVVHAYYPQGETRVEREAHALRRHNIDVDVLCLRGSTQLALCTVDGVQVYRLPVRRHKDKGVVAQLFEYLNFFVRVFICLTHLHWQKRYDVVQVHNLPDFLVFAALVPKLMGAKIILDLHDLMPEFYAERFHRSLNNPLVRLVCWQERLSCCFADHVITVTDHWRQSLIRRGVPPEKCSVLMNLADPRIFRKPVQQDPKPQNDGQFKLIYHGAIPERYGLDLVLRAIAQLRREIPDIHFTIIGGGEYLKDLKRLTEELNLEKQVCFEGFIPAKALPAHLLTADLAVVPYRDDIFTNELLPTKLLEYAILGVPALVSHTMGISTYFDETMVQFFTPGDVDELTDCIRSLYHDRTRLAKLAENIEKFNRRYNWASQSENYIRIVKRLCQ
jgi:glycosyltransferase involved in cell wall biosynthesis